MEIENSFKVAAPPDRVFTFLLDVNQVAGCLPGADVSELIDPETFRGRVRISVGPTTVTYLGIARITNRNQAARRADLEAEGLETTGSGSARLRANMTVTEAPGGSEVKFSAEFTVTGRVAQYGRGLIEDISRRLISQMGDCISRMLEAPSVVAAVTHGAIVEGTAVASTLPARGKPINALSLLLTVLWKRIRGFVARGR